MRFLAGTRDLVYLRNIQTFCGAQPGFSSRGNGGPFAGSKVGPDVRFTTDPLLVQRVTTPGAISMHLTPLELA